MLSRRTHPTYKHMLKNIFAGIESEGELVEDIADISKEEKLTLSESETEKKTEEEEEGGAPSQGGAETEEQKKEREDKEAAAQKTLDEEEEKIPFHKHPRFKALVDEKNAYKTKLEELEKRQEELETKIKPTETKVEISDIPAWFVEVFGENPEAYAKYQEQNKTDREALKSEVLEELKQSSHKEEDAIAEGKKYIEDQVELLKEKGISFDRNALMKAMNDEPIFDKSGNLDFITKARLLELENKKPIAQKKIVKNMISEDGAKNGGAEENKTRTYKTPEDMRRVSWNGIGSK